MSTPVFTPAPTPGDTAWFTHDRFGMFIHWGLYALPSRHEWVASKEQIGPESYARYFEQFNPDLFEPRSWARAAREAGMKYVVVTAKHHEGFCLWDSQFTDYKATNTPFARDALREILEAFRAEGLRIGLYYSLLDWHHPHFTLDGYHPLRSHPDPAAFDAGRDMTIYAQYMRDQVRELLTGYGPIDIIWFDFSYLQAQAEGANGYHLPGKGAKAWESEALYALVRELRPGIIVNNRLDLPDSTLTDVQTPEQFQPREWVKVNEQPVVWEACHTFSNSWGYYRDEHTWKSSGQLIRMLVDIVSKGGNLLMNVGPTSRGEFDHRAQEALNTYAKWMRAHGRAIDGCSQSEFQAPTDTRYTQNFEQNRLYVHVFAYPFLHLHLPGLAGKVKYAQFLHDGSEIRLDLHDWTAEQVQRDSGEGNLVLELPVLQPPFEVPVIELFLA